MRQMSGFFFFLETKFPRQKNGWEEKNKLGELSTKEIQKITDNAVPGTRERSE